MASDLEVLNKDRIEVKICDSEYNRSDKTSEPITTVSFSEGSTTAAVNCEKGLTFIQGLFISLNYNLGFSVVVFPFHIERSGWIGFLTFTLAGIATYLTAGFIAEIMYMFPEIKTYSDIGVKATQTIFGPQNKFAIRFTKTFFRIFQQMVLFTYLIFDFLIVQDALHAVKPDFSTSAVLLVSNILLLPMVLFALSPKLLSIAGVLGTIAFVMLYFLILATGILANTEGGTSELTNNSTNLGFQPESSVEFFGAYGGILLLFAGHAAYPSIFSALEDKKDMFLVISYTYVSIGVTTIPIAILLILGYGKDAITDLPTGYLPEGTVENVVGQVLMMLKAVLCQATIVHPIIFEISNSIHRRFFRLDSNTKDIHTTDKSPNFSLKKMASDMEEQPLEEICTEDESENLSPMEAPSMMLKLIVGLITSLLAFGASEIIPSLAFIISFTGAIFAISLNLTLPSLSFLATMDKESFPVKTKLAALLVLPGLTSSCISLVYVFHHD